MICGPPANDVMLMLYTSWTAFLTLCCHFSQNITPYGMDNSFSEYTMIHFLFYSKFYLLGMSVLYKYAITAYFSYIQKGTYLIFFRHKLLLSKALMFFECF